MLYNYSLPLSSKPQKVHGTSWVGRVPGWLTTNVSTFVYFTIQFSSQGDLKEMELLFVKVLLCLLSGTSPFQSQFAVEIKLGMWWWWSVTREPKNKSRGILKGSFVQTSRELRRMPLWGRYRTLRLLLLPRFWNFPSSQIVLQLQAADCD